MKTGGWLFALIVGAYVLFEVTLLHKLGYRMEVDHILHQMVSAEHAVRRCAEASDSQTRKYEKRLATLKTRAKREAKENNPGMKSAETDVFLNRQITEIQTSVDAVISRQGCDGPDVDLMVRQFRIYAGKG